jgi:hypothetical protein
MPRTVKTRSGQRIWSCDSENGSNTGENRLISKSLRREVSGWGRVVTVQTIQLLVGVIMEAVSEDEAIRRPEVTNSGRSVAESVLRRRAGAAVEQATSRGEEF